MTGTPSFIELGTKDLARAQGFWGGLFGWDFAKQAHGASFDITDGVGGGMHVDPDGGRMYVYFRVSNLDETIAKVLALGGEVDEVRPGSDEFGTFAECRDNQGVIFGLHEPPARTAD